MAQAHEGWQMNLWGLVWSEWDGYWYNYTLDTSLYRLRNGWWAGEGDSVMGRPLDSHATMEEALQERFGAPLQLSGHTFYPRMPLGGSFQRYCHPDPDMPVVFHQPDEDWWVEPPSRTERIALGTHAASTPEEAMDLFLQASHRRLENTMQDCLSRMAKYRSLGRPG